MSNELINPEEEFDFASIAGKGSAYQLIVDENPELGVNAAGGSFNPYIKFISGKAKIVTKKKFPADHYGLHSTPGSEIPDVDLGESFEAIFLERRIVAVMEVGEKYCRFYDPQSEEYKAAKAKAELPGMNGAFHGYEWLMWLPVQDVIATFHFNSASTKNLEVTTFKLGPVGKTLKFSWRGASNTKGDWTTPVISFSETKYRPKKEDLTRFQNAITAFANPVSSGPLLASSSADGSSLPVDR